MKLINYILASMLLLTAGLFSGCSDDDDSRAGAVLSSATSLNFSSTNAGTKTIMIYADGDWTVEAPEWVVVTPDHGSMTMEVTVSAADNMRDGAVDNPRKENVIFKGRDLRSIAEVLILQDGDKYRDCPVVGISDIDGAADESVIEIKNAVVASLTTSGFVISENGVNVLATISSTTEISGNGGRAAVTPVSVGDRLDIKAEKLSDGQKLAYIACDEVVILSSGETVTYPEPVNITDKIASYSSNTRTYIQIDGVVDGRTIKIDGAEASAQMVDAPADMDITSLNGHVVSVTGYFAGIATPVVRIIPVAIEDKGVFEIVYFQEDFEWLAPYSAVVPAGKTVEEDNLDAAAPQISDPKKAGVDGVTAEDVMIEKGYEFLRVCDPSKKIGECIYLQTNYLKFGKTSYQAGIILPAIADVPDNTTVKLSFDWCPMRQGSGKIDPVNLIVIVGDETYEIPTHGWENDHRLEWIRAEVTIPNVDKDTRITIRQTEWPAKTANRWFLDNIKIIKAE